ncbi:MAG: competence protein CoiA family protein [Candidatus Hodarchaeota archaeon]
MSNLLSSHSTKSESFYHKTIKRLFFKYISENNRDIIEKSVEKYINNRRADVYFRFKSGEQIVIEIQNSKIPIKEIITRTEHYNNDGIYILWVLYGDGSCVASPKVPEDKRDIKISIIENFLHRMYGGRVYYVNIHLYENKITISPPFALHFSQSSSKKYRKLFQTKFEKFYIKNVNYVKIPSWSLLFVNYNGFKLARFYDKNIKRVLKEKIFNFIKKKIIKELDNNKSDLKSNKFYHRREIIDLQIYKKKQLIKLILKQFNNSYGKSIIFQSLLELIQERKIEFDKKFVLKKLSFFSREKKEIFKY